MKPTTRAHNAQAVLQARDVTFDDSVRICESHYASVENIPPIGHSGRCAIACFCDKSKVVFSDAYPKGIVFE